MSTSSGSLAFDLGLDGGAGGEALDTGGATAETPSNSAIRALQRSILRWVRAHFAVYFRSFRSSSSKALEYKSRHFKLETVESEAIVAKRRERKEVVKGLTIVGCG